VVKSNKVSEVYVATVYREASAKSGMSGVTLKNNHPIRIFYYYFYYDAPMLSESFFSINFADHHYKRQAYYMHDSLKYVFALCVVTL